VIGGLVALRLDSDALRRLAGDRTVVLVSGTNGKTTTTRLLTTALATQGRASSNAAGANMPAGLVATLAADLHAPTVVLEVDEPHLPTVLAATRPRLVVLLNLSRDQLDRVGEVAMVARSWQRALRATPTPVVANADDPLVTLAARDAPSVTWVGAGQLWYGDSSACPDCGRNLPRTARGHWSCPCGARRPTADWWLDGEELALAEGRRVSVALPLPGRANRSNAAMAAVAAVDLGVPVETATAAMARVASVEGRYAVTEVRGRLARLLLVKNPAGWLDAMTMLAAPPVPTVFAVNARVADGCDTSWLWDLPVHALHGRRVVACGERRLDLAVRLEHAGVEPTVARDPLEALAQIPPGPVDVVCTYTAFQGFRAAAARAG
jgi:UDP-N-acetylmuramyl tripeptide synthase